jgi:hypothetical protein
VEVAAAVGSTVQDRVYEDELLPALQRLHGLPAIVPLLADGCAHSAREAVNLTRWGGRGRRRFDFRLLHLLQRLLAVRAVVNYSGPLGDELLEDPLLQGLSPSARRPVPR